MKRRRGRVWVLRHKKALALGAICLLFAGLIRIFANTGAADGLSRAFRWLADDPARAEQVLAHELTPAEQSEEDAAHDMLDVLSAQSTWLQFSADAPEELPTIEFVPWKLVQPTAETKSSGGEKPIKPLAINPTSPNGYVNLGKIYLKNDSTKTIDLNAYLKADMPFALKGEGPHVLIVHTHGSEAYTPAGRDTYTPDDNERTTDTRYNVVRVGDEIENILKSRGISVVHDRTIYDSPSYNGSYTRTLAGICAQMKKTPGITVMLDIHRDSMVSKSGVKYKTYATVNGKPSAQIMLVMSTGESGLPHPNWQENLKFGVKLQCRIANKYPGLLRPINLRTERFNMHVTTGSLLLEVGSSGNTLEEALTAVRPLSEELAALLNAVKK